MPHTQTTLKTEQQEMMSIFCTCHIRLLAQALSSPLCALTLNGYITKQDIEKLASVFHCLRRTGREQ